MPTFGQRAATTLYEGLAAISTYSPLPVSVSDFFLKQATRVKNEGAHYDKLKAQVRTEDHKRDAEVEQTIKVEDDKAKSYVTMTQAMTGQKIALYNGMATLEMQASSTVEQAEAAGKEAKLHGERALSLKELQASQDAAKQKLQESSKLQEKVDESRTEMAKEGKEAAVNHGKAVKEAQTHEKEGIKTTMDTAVGVTRHAFALQIIEKVAFLEMQKLDYQNQLDNVKLDYKGQLDQKTADKRLVLEKNVAEVDASKTQYLDGLKANLSIKELRELSKLMSDKLTAESFAEQQKQRSEIRPQTESAAAEGAKLAEVGRQSEQRTVKGMGDNEQKEVVSRTNIYTALEQSEGFRTSLAALPQLFDEAAQAKVDDKLGKNQEVQKEELGAAANDNSSEQSLATSTSSSSSSSSIRV